MTSFQKAVKYLAMAFAIFLIVSIFSGILGVLGLFSGLSAFGSATGDMKAYTVSGNISKLEIDINAADLTIKTADSFSVESNLTNLSVKEKNGTLVIAEKKKPQLNYNDAVLTIGIPDQHIFETVDICTGAGQLSADRISTLELSLELGAGRAEIDILNADAKATIRGGAGEVIISSGVLHNLDLDMGAGELNLTAALLGSCELDYGIGEANLTLVGSKDDYRLELDKGIGSINVEGQSMRDDSVYGTGRNQVEINGGIGEANVYFQ